MTVIPDRIPLILIGILLPLGTLCAQVTPVAGPEGLTDEAAGQLGRGLYPGAAGIMRVRHAGNPERTLTLREKAALRPIFGSLVDRVKFKWSADPMDEWGPIRLGYTVGQTFGHRIYIREPYVPEWSRWMLSLVIHEIVHSRQYETVGSSLNGFGYHYFKSWAQAGFSYRRNVMEVEAEAVAHEETDAAWQRYRAHSH